jgi:hypothetical protein
VSDLDFTCECCGGTFPKAWTDEEAQAEAAASGFVDDLVVICDDCFEATWPGLWYRATGR